MVTMTSGLDIDQLRAAGNLDDVLEQFISFVAERKISLYPAQEEALLEIFAGSHVIVNTPTGSGKSLIALGAHVAAAAMGRRTFYTAPIKALVSEKFFSLCSDLGAKNVGMLTGDAVINPNAPVVCATAEIVANMALRGGAITAIDQVVMDEFHFYGDPDRGWAWQVPLLEIHNAQFVLMSATLGDTRAIEQNLMRRTGRQVQVVRSAIRPVPLSFEYRKTPLHETIESLIASDQAPLYVVHFTQAAAAAHAQALTSAQVSTRADREKISKELEGFKFAPGFGRTLSRLLHHGIGVHHGGMLPKYRRLVERMTQAGLLKVVVGTDTLGVGVNLPLRCVVLTGMAKYDGTTSRLLSARELHQISGRAGRAGYDTSGLVVVQAPEHVIENERTVEKAAGDARKVRKIVRAKPPRGYVPYDEAIFARLVGAAPEPLVSSLKVGHGTVLNVLDRPGNGCRHLKRLLTDNDEAPAAKAKLIHRAAGIYRSLLAGGALERLDEPDEWGRTVRVTVDLQAEFALDRPLSPFLMDAIPLLDKDLPTYALDVTSVVEATLENPGSILAAQLDKLRTETLGQLKAAGVEYEERIEALDKLEYPKPLRDWTYDLFDAYRLVHPWASDSNIAPKSIVRDMFERAMTFGEYVSHYGIARSEGLLLRYLSDAYRALDRSVFEAWKTDEVLDIIEWLKELVRQVDSSLIDEWERLAAMADGILLNEDLNKVGTGDITDLASQELVPGLATSDAPPALSANVRAFLIMIRNAAFRRVELAAVRDIASLVDGEQAGGYDKSTWQAALDEYFGEHDSIGTGSDARSTQWFSAKWYPGAQSVLVRQVLDDPDGFHDVAFVGEVDIGISDELGYPAWRTIRIDRG